MQVAIQSWHQQQQQATNAAIQTIYSHRRSLWAAAVLADRVLGELSTGLVAVLGIKTNVRKVSISSERQAHILNAHKIQSHGDPTLASARLSDGLASPLALRLPKRANGTFDLVCRSEATTWNVMIAIKFVPAARSRSGSDEWWVQTAYPVARERELAWHREGLVMVLDTPANPAGLLDE